MARWLLGAGLTLFLSAAVVAADDKEPGAPAGYVKVEIKGTLQTGLVAVGGETTGTVVRTRDATLELDLGKNKELREQAGRLKGKTVVVTGTLIIRQGIEVPQRLIVKVAGLKAADAEK